MAMLAQGLIFGALAPLLPAFERELRLSKDQAGLLVGMFPVGQALVALPVGLLASRFAAKRFSIASLVIFGMSSAAFGLADSYYELLGGRFLQGVAGGLCLPSALAWVISAGPSTRRGEMIGILSGGAAAGQMVGPAIGGLAALTGRGAVFIAVGVAFMALAAIGARFPGPELAERQSLSALRKAHASRSILGGQWLIVVPSTGLGAMFVLAPLQLDRLGASAVEIAGTFLVTAFLGALARPLVGRWADQHGLLNTTTTLLLVPALLVLFLPWAESWLIVSACTVISVAVWGALFGPTAALLSHAYEAARIGHVFGFALTSLTAAIGIFLGSAAGGAIAKVAGDAMAYSMVAGISLATVAALVLLRRVAAVAR
jgi:DHA1 family solute carrier family 18 vesicular amine transporter 1/2